MSDGRQGGHARCPGLRLEKLNNAKDPRIRTIRITDFWRGVVLAPAHGDEYVLLSVLPQDKANAFATSKKFSVNQKLGVLEVRDQTGLEGFLPHEVPSPNRPTPNT